MEDEKPCVWAPTVHLNGTPAEHLEAYLRQAIDALRATTAALVACSPNQRDYYVQGPHAFAKANADHTERLLAIQHVREEIAEIHERVLDQIDARKAQRAGL